VVQSTVTNVTTTLAVNTATIPTAPQATPTLAQTTATTAPSDTPPTDSGSGGEEGDKDAVVVPNASASTDAPVAAAPMPVCK
jgi:hypothetical protein